MKLRKLVTLTLVFCLSLQGAQVFNSNFANALALNYLNGKIAFSKYTNDGAIDDRHIYITNSDGSGTATRLTANGGSSIEQEPIWSPDGSKIAFSKYTDDGTIDDKHLFIANSDGSGTPNRLTANGFGIFEESPTWSPDGSKIAFSKYTNDGAIDDRHIYITNSDGSGTATRLTANGGSSIEQEPIWSPDGSKIAFSKYTDDGTIDDKHLFIANSDGSGTPNRLTANGFGIFEESPTWSPDGSKIAFSKYTNDGAIDDRHIYITNSDGSGTATRLTANGGSSIEQEPIWSPDGSKIAFSKYTDDGTIDDKHLFIANSDGSGTPNRLTANGFGIFEESPTWQPVPIGTSVTNQNGSITTTINSGQDYSSVSYDIAANETLVVNGTLGNVTVLSGGTLKGTGTVGTITVQSGGHVAPGNSPGCLNSGNVSLASGSSFDVEIAGTTVCTQYDRLNVTGTVDVTGATLNIALLSGFVPAVGNAFTIISNDGADAITGTFAGLAQGGSVTVNGVTYQISYTGGDGNDVVLTVTTVAPGAGAAAPAAPDTGLGLIAAHPLSALAASTAAALALILIARRLKPAHVTNRR